MPSVTILGGGFAGMALALFLQEHNIPATIYELREEGLTSGGNIALAPNALRVLDHLDLYDAIRTKGFNYEELAFANGNGQELGKFLNGSQKVYNYQAVRIHRTVVRDALRQRCKEQNIDIHYGMKCTGIVIDGERKVQIGFEDGQIITSDFAVGADGIHSTIRSHVEPNASSPTFSGLMGIMGTVMDSELSGISHPFSLPAMLFGSKGSFAIMPSSYTGEEVGYFATIEEDDRSRAEWDRLGHDKQALFKMLEERYAYQASTWPEYVQALCRKAPAETLTSWPFFSAPKLESWVSQSGRVFLIGDAAHAIPPTGGQGAAMALEDAETLAYTLAESLISPSKEELRETSDRRLVSLTTAWNTHRQSRVKKVLDFTTKNGSLRKSSPHFYEQAAKEWLMWASFKLTGPEAGVQWMYEYNAESVKAVFA